MKVLFSTYPTSFSVPGGGEHQITNTKKYLEKLGVEITKFDIWSPIDHLKFDLLHIFSVCNSMEFYVDWAIRNKVPYVVSPILWPNERYSDDESHRLRHIFNNAKYILPNSISEKSRIVTNLAIHDRGQFVKIINGIEPEKFLELNRNASLIDDNLVVSIANIDRRKNHLILAEACKRTDKKLILAGRIRDVNYFEEIISRYAGVVSYVGPIENSSEQHLNLLQKASIFALPSLCETPGIAAIEAGASAVPVLLTQIGAGPEYFGEHAVYCDPLSVESICDGLIILTNQSAIISKDGRDCFASYTWGLAAEQTFRVYQQVIEQENYLLTIE